MNQASNKKVILSLKSDYKRQKLHAVGLSEPSMLTFIDDALTGFSEISSLDQSDKPLSLSRDLINDD